MSTEKMMNMVEEEPQNYDNNNMNNDESLKNMNENKNENFSQLYSKNYLHILANTIINLGLLIIVIIEFIIRGKNDYIISNFDILVTLFILFESIFIILNYFKSEQNYIKGMVFYPFVTSFWGLGDLLSFLVLSDNYEWNNADILKVTKVSLIVLNAFINIYYLFCCKNKF